MSNDNIKTLKVDTSIKSKVTTGVNIIKYIVVSIVFTGVGIFIYNLNNSKDNNFVIIGNSLIFIPSYIFLGILFFYDNEFSRNDYLNLIVVFCSCVFAIIVSLQKKDVQKLEGDKLVKKKEVLQINIFLSAIFFIIFIFFLILLILSRVFKLF